MLTVSKVAMLIIFIVTVLILYSWHCCKRYKTTQKIKSLVLGHVSRAYIKCKLLEHSVSNFITNWHSLECKPLIYK